MSQETFGALTRVEIRIFLLKFGELEKITHFGGFLICRVYWKSCHPDGAASARVGCVKISRFRISEPASYRSISLFFSRQPILHDDWATEKAGYEEQTD